MGEKKKEENVQKGKEKKWTGAAVEEGKRSEGSAGRDEKERAGDIYSRLSSAHSAVFKMLFSVLTKHPSRSLALLILAPLTISVHAHKCAIMTH